MITKIYTIYDSKARVYNKPFFVLNDDVCLRSVLQMKGGDTDIATNPEDFSVWYLGTYDDNTAQLDLCGTPKVIAKVHELFGGSNNEA